jgi:hypothetical protein
MWVLFVAVAASKLVTSNGSHLKCEGENFDPSSKYKGEKIWRCLKLSWMFLFSALLLHLEHLKQFVFIFVGNLAIV